MDESWMVADLHIHSRFSRACSKDLNFENLVKWARIKGLNLLGTGDFTHPIWIQEIKDKLIEKKGLYYYNDFPFIITGEISLIYTQGRGRKVHLVVLVPNIETAEKINSYLDKKGRRDYDGRPIFKISCEQFVKDMTDISKDIEIIPAHCLSPDSFLHTDNGVKKIKDILIGERVLTHRGRFKKVTEVLSHKFKGKLLRIVPWYFTKGLETTPEHPFYAIKSYKNCRSTKGLCKPLCSQVKKGCARKYFNNYVKEWIIAKDIEKGDFLVYPRLKKENNFDKIDIVQFIGNHKSLDKKYIVSENARNHTGKIKRYIDTNKDFCRLMGYFLSEGYLIGNSAVGFSFNSKEQEYIAEVILFMKNLFGFKVTKIDSRRKNQSDIIFCSKLLNLFFKNFYKGDPKKANTKFIPDPFLYLSSEKIAEIFRGWWRGDTGNTVSKQLAHQMKIICLKLGIIPSISIHTAENHRKYKHFIGGREIFAREDLIVFSNLSFFENDYGMLKELCFKKSINKINRKHGWVDENYIYLPVRKIESRDYNGEVYNLEVEEDNSYVSEFACIHNCWTPHFGVFGSMSGFDSLKEAFGEQADNVHAIETGISSDPLMNWRIKFLANKSIVSFSDSHSFWPWRLGREATIFKKTDSYSDLLKQIRENNFIATIEADPAYGKYHYDGHRLCNFSCSPEKTKEINGICPVCGKALTIGVEHRVEYLADKEPEKYKKYYTLLPLHEIISLAYGAGMQSKKIWDVYYLLINAFGNEFEILLHASKSKMIEAGINDNLVELILKNREGKIIVKPGFDGEYGKAVLEEKQATLF